VRAGHDGKIDGVAARVGAQRSVPLVVSEAVLDANDNPARSAVKSGERETNQRLVKTTPKPRATKKSSGELLELPGPPLACVAVAEGLVVWAVEFAGSVADGEGDGIVELMIDGERRASKPSPAEDGAQAEVKQAAIATATDGKRTKMQQVTAC
jgi:hypothetical protein